MSAPRYDSSDGDFDDETSCPACNRMPPGESCGIHPEGSGIMLPRERVTTDPVSVVLATKCPEGCNRHYDGYCDMDNDGVGGDMFHASRIRAALARKP